MSDWKVLIFFATLLFSCKSHQASDVVGSLEDIDWVLVEVAGVSITTPPGGREVFMRLSRQGDAQMLKGYAGCNGLGGDYKQKGQSISFQPITTKMYCELQMDIENKFTKMLSDTNRFRMKGGVLELYSDDELLGKFTARR